MRRRRLDIGEGEFAIGVGNALDLIEARKRVSHVALICERLLALPGKGVDAFWQIATRGQIAVLRMGLPSGLCGHLLLLYSIVLFVVFAQLLSSPRFSKPLALSFAHGGSRAKTAHIRHVLTERGGKIDLMILLLHQNLADLLGDGKLAKRIKLPNLFLVVIVSYIFI